MKPWLSASHCQVGVCSRFSDGAAAGAQEQGFRGSALQKERELSDLNPRKAKQYLEVFQHDVVLVRVAVPVRPPDVVVQVERQLFRLPLYLGLGFWGLQNKARLSCQLLHCWSEVASHACC